MSAKEYWHKQARSPTILMIGGIVMWLLSENGDAAIGYALGAVALVVAMLVFVASTARTPQSSTVSRRSKRSCSRFARRGPP